MGDTHSTAHDGDHDSFETTNILPKSNTHSSRPRSRSGTVLSSHSSAGSYPRIKVFRATSCGPFVVWWLEILAAAFSLICIAFNVAFLAAIDGEPYQSWRMGNVDITPNTIISLVSTLSKSSLLLVVAEGISQLKWLYFQREPHRLVDLQTFDYASRGPLGSLQFLWRIRFRAMFASVGAIVTILALFTDPFTQQVLSYPSRLDSVSDPVATIGSATAFSGGFASLPDEWNDATDLPSTQATEMLNTMSASIFGKPLALSYACPSGTCQWPIFDSLGLCSECEDISNQTQTSCTQIKLADSTPSDTYFCTYNTPLGTRFFSIWVLAEQVWYPSTNLNISVNATPDGKASEIMHGSLVNLISLRLDRKYTTHPPDIIPSVTSCKLTWCIKTFSNTAVYHGVPNDEPSTLWSLKVDPKSCRAGANSDTSFNGTHFYGSVCSAYKDQQVGSSTGTDPGLAQGYDIPYQLNGTDSAFLQVALLETFYTTKWLNSGVAGFAKQMAQNNKSVIPNDNFRELQSYDRIEKTFPSPMQQALYYSNNGNFSATMDAMTTSMTNELRNGANATKVKGAVFEPTVHVHVNWPWLIYPALLSPLAILFLVISIFSSMRRDRLVWKSSSLPLLFHGLRGWNEQHLEATDCKEIEKRSENMWARLNRDEKGLLSLHRS